MMNMKREKARFSCLFLCFVVCGINGFVEEGMVNVA